MKSKYLAIAGAVTLLGLSACGGVGSGKSIDDIGARSEADTLSTYYGELYALNYWQDAYGDTTLRADEARKSYLEGVKKGLDLAKDNSNYNEGVMLGVQLAQQMAQFEKDYGVRLKPELLLNGLAYGMQNDSITDQGKVQQEVNMIMTRLGNAKDARDREAAGKALAAYASKNQYSCISPILYQREANGGEGELLKRGDRLGLSFKATDASGRMIPGATNRVVTVGRELHQPPYVAALLAMRPMETSQFATSAFEVYGLRCAQAGFSPDDIILFTITTGKLISKGETASEAPESEEAGTTPAQAKTISPAGK